MRRITMAAIGTLALCACSRTGTLEGDVYVVTQDGTVKRGVGARVYLVPEHADQSVLATEDTLCVQAANQQQFSSDNRRTAIEDRTRWFEEKADSLKQEAERLPPDARVRMLRNSNKMLVDAYARRDRDRLALATEGPLGRAGTCWLLHRLRAAYESASVASAKAGIEAHYVLNDVPRGTYSLVAFTEPRTRDTEGFLGWRAEVEVPGGYLT